MLCVIMENGRDHDNVCYIYPNYSDKVCYVLLLKMEEITIMFVIFILIMLTSFAKCKIPTIYVTEGDVAFLNFTYSCDSKKITLQRGNGAPLYNSRNPIPPSSSNLKLRNETSGEMCFLYLTINPVSRDDEGGYILTAYLDGPRLFEDDRILLLVAYPPGEASCVLSEEYIGEDWFRLHCSAPLGSIKGLITCYQDGIKIPTLNSTQEHDETLSQTLLAKVGSLVYCCSSTLNRIKDRCDCKDSVWDPTQNKQVKNVMDPCPPTVSTQHPTFSHYSMEDNDFESPSPSTKAAMIISLQPHSNKALLIPEVVFGFLILALIASIAGTVSYFKRRPQMSASSDIESAVRERIFSEEERHLLCEASTNPASYKVEKRHCEESASKVSGVKFKKGAERDGYQEWRLVERIDVTDEITLPLIVGCIDESNVIITDGLLRSLHTYMLDMNTKHIQRVIAGSVTSSVVSCALLNGKIVCGNGRETGNSLTECISVYDRQWNPINDVTIPRNTTDDVSWMEVAADQDGMIIAAEDDQSKIYVINPADGNIMNTITSKQDVRMRGVLSSGHIIAQPSPFDHRVLVIDREGVQREITHSDVIWNVCIDPMTDDLYVVTSDDECKTCMIDQVMSGGDMKKRRVASFPISTRLTKIDDRRIPLTASQALMTSSGNMIASDGDNILIFKQMPVN